VFILLQLYNWIVISATGIMKLSIARVFRIPMSHLRKGISAPESCKQCITVSVACESIWNDVSFFNNSFI
jgi:hypothetical protein